MQKRSSRAAFRNAMGRDPGRSAPFNLNLGTEQQSPRALDRAALFHYWHPDRNGVEFAPEHIQAKIDAVAGKDEQGRSKAVLVRPPANAPVRARCWLVFKRSPEVVHDLSPGWFLVLAWHDGREPHPRPLHVEDPRLLANLYLQSVKAGREVMGRDFDSAVQYFDHITAVSDREKKQRDAANDQYRDDRANDYYQYTKIKNIGHGSKYSLHHDGTIAPSRGEHNWNRERGLDLPSDVVERDRAEMQQADRSVFAGAPSITQRERVREAAHIMQEIARMRSRVSIGLDLPKKSPYDK